MQTKSVKCSFIDLPMVKPKPVWLKMQTIEDTGIGNDICVDMFFGRVFLSDVGAVHDILGAFSEEYGIMCNAVDEDPAGEYFDVLNYNDLYQRLHLDPCIAGNDWGWPTAEDWRCHSLDWDEEWVDSGPYAEKYGKAVYMFAPKEYCKPMECYMEVC